MKKSLLVAPILLSVLSFADAVAQTPPPCTEKPKSFTAWINCRVEDIVKAKITQRDNTKQTETPSIGGSSTSLVDQSKASDLIGAALNLSGLSDNPEAANRSFSFTVSGYSLYAAASNHDPLDPAFYLKNANWRRFWVTLGQEAPTDSTSASSMAPNNERATITGFKVLLVDKRDLRYHNLGTISVALAAANPNFAAIVDEVQNYIYSVLKASAGNPTLGRFLNDNLGADKIAATMDLLKEEDIAAINKIIEDRILPEITLTDTIKSEIAKIRKAPQFSLSFLSKTRKEGLDEYKAEAIFDYGVHSRINLSLNGAFNYMDSKLAGGDIRGASFSGQLQFQITPESKLVGRNPIYFSISSEGKWMSGMESQYKAQGKVTIPITEGIDLPISLTFANRTNLIDEKEVRGQFGFTFDLARLIKAVAFK